MATLGLSLARSLGLSLARPLSICRSSSRSLARSLGLSIALLAVACAPKAGDELWLNADVPLEGTPAYQFRILDHWDNLDDSVERGYAGKSIWEWTSDSLPRQRIDRYARLNEKIGINGIVLNNVNTDPRILTRGCLIRVKEIADILRKHGIKTYLSVNFASPMALGELPSADPLDESVRHWWRDKTEEIYGLIPDFGGYLVKASSEGQPGPQDFGRSHADGANMLAEMLEPHGGIVMWRAFVYSAKSPDRAGQAAEEFLPLDGCFAGNVVLQIKNGPVDFQPREPFSPLFGLLHHTTMAPELQITQEYLGQSRNFVFLAPMWEEFFGSDTYRDGEGSTLARLTTAAPRSVIAGVANAGQDTNWCGSVIAGVANAGQDANWCGSVIAGVANVGQDANWCGSVAAQANWYAFGRLAWDPTLSSEQIAEEWLRFTFAKPWLMSEKRFTRRFIEPVKAMMLSSRETCVDFMMPLGLHHIFAADGHYGPDPEYKDTPMPRPDWEPKYYHKADSIGLGFDRTASGSNTVSQYNEPLASLFAGPDCPENLILWFHHVPWDYKMSGGRTLWQELCFHYNSGVEQSIEYERIWKRMKPYVDKARYADIERCLKTQVHDAKWWRDVCLGYFQRFSGMPLD